VQNARVSLYRRDAFSGTGMMALAGGFSTDAMGKFEFTRLPEGDYLACSFGTDPEGAEAIRVRAGMC
jgi:hypothetical protein